MRGEPTAVNTPLAPGCDEGSAGDGSGTGLCQVKHCPCVRFALCECERLTSSVGPCFVCHLFCAQRHHLIRVKYLRRTEYSSSGTVGEDEPRSICPMRCSLDATASGEAVVVCANPGCNHVWVRAPSVGARRRRLSHLRLILRARGTQARGCTYPMASTTTSAVPRRPHEPLPRTPASSPEATGSLRSCDHDKRVNKSATHPPTHPRTRAPRGM